MKSIRQIPRDTDAAQDKVMSKEVACTRPLKSSENKESETERTDLSASAPIQGRKILTNSTSRGRPLLVSKRPTRNDELDDRQVRFIENLEERRFPDADYEGKNEKTSFYWKPYVFDPSFTCKESISYIKDGKLYMKLVIPVFPIRPLIIYPFGSLSESCLFSNLIPEKFELKFKNNEGQDMGSFLFKKNKDCVSECGYTERPIRGSIIILDGILELYSDD